LILHELSSNSIKEKIIKREITAQEVVEDLFERIYLKEPSIKAYLYLDKEGALLKAREIDEKLSNGVKVGLLAGIPVEKRLVRHEC
jgi:aspartyl-tRNA(Asn)/glutamyl-tRNA(Gln) amidotransferase subunit A